MPIRDDRPPIPRSLRKKNLRILYHHPIMMHDTQLNPNLDGPFAAGFLLKENLPLLNHHESTWKLHTFFFTSFFFKQKLSQSIIINQSSSPLVGGFNPPVGRGYIYNHKDSHLFGDSPVTSSCPNTGPHLKT